MFVGFGCWFGFGWLGCVFVFVFDLVVCWVLSLFFIYLVVITRLGGWLLFGGWVVDCLIELWVACLDFLFCYCGCYGLCFSFG